MDKWNATMGLYGDQFYLLSKHVIYKYLNGRKYFLMRSILFDHLVDVQPIVVLMRDYLISNGDQLLDTHYLPCL